LATERNFRRSTCSAGPLLLVIAIIAGILGFGAVAGTAFSVAKIVFIVALIAFLISGVLGYTRRGMP